MVNLHGEEGASCAPRMSELGGSEKFRQGPTNPLSLPSDYVKIAIENGDL